MKTRTLPFLFFFLFYIAAGYLKAQIQLGQDIDGEAAGDNSGWSVSMPDAYTIAIGAARNDGNGSDAGHVRVYRWNGSSWVQKGIDIDGEAAEDRSGWSVSMPDSNTLAIGATYNDGNGINAGHVRVYQWNGTSWVQKGLDIDGEAASDQFGNSVSMPDSNTVAIGTPNNDGNGTAAGHVRIFSWNGSSWVQKGLDIDGEATGDFAGRSVSMPDANTVAIGADGNSGTGLNSGHVRIYRWNGSSWIQKGIDIDGEAADDASGWSVSMPDSNTVAIGSVGNTNFAGHVRIYRWNGSNWVQKGLDIDGEAASDQLGNSVSMPNSNTVAIGAYFNDGTGTDAGHVRVYGWSGSSWVQLGIDIDGETAGDQSGRSVSMPDSNTVAIGATYNDGTGTDAGHVRIYKLKGVQGLVYNDLNKNCILEESGIVVDVRGIIQPGNIVVETNNSGSWSIDSLPAGDYTISYDTSGNWRSTCPNPDSFTVIDPNQLTIIPGFGMVSINPCAEPTVSVTMPRMRPGFSDQKLYVQACNEKRGTGTLDSAWVILELDSLLTVQSSSLAYTSLGNHKYRFELGTLKPGECKSFSVACSLSVNAVLGQTLCMEAELYPVDSCVLDTMPADTPSDFTPCSLPWDKSSIAVDGWCQNDSIYFTITNTGEPGGGDMDCFSPLRLYIDGIYVVMDSVKLLGGEVDTLAFAGNGRTWRLEVDQHPLHPGSSHPNATVELCGDDSNWTPGLVNILPMDDADPVVDVYCGLVTGSYDPNDKQGFPLGVTDTNFVAPNGKMDYVIRFQNTGTDTAFTVVIRDTLDADLDIFSVRSGASSHNYTFRMYGPRVLEWTFENILLPDSGTDQQGSNGFVSFTVNQVKDLPDYTEINNSAGIYFDFNAPIITNTTSHVVHRKVLQPSWSAQKTIAEEECDVFSYNNYSYTQSGSYWQFENDTLVTMNVTINHSDSVRIDTSIEEGSTYAVGDTVLTEAGEHTISYVTAHGCDSIITVNLEMVDGVLESKNTTKLYPNPNTGTFILDFGNDNTDKSVVIKDVTGKEVHEMFGISQKQIKVILDAPKGLYFVHINTDRGLHVMKLVKE